MQCNSNYTDLCEYKSVMKPCVSTSTPDGLINLYRAFEDEWFSYETITESFFLYKWNAANLKSLILNNAEVLRKTLEKTKKKKNIAIGKYLHEKNETICTKYESNTKIISDEPAAGDKTTDDFPFLPMRKSLFPHVAPYVIFHDHDRTCSKNPSKNVPQFLKWKLTKSTPKVVVKILVNSGYRIITRGNDWSAIWNAPINDLSKYQGLKSFQKVNSFPGSHNLNNKGELWLHLNRMRRKFGFKEYGFMPKTYLLPKDMQKFENMWQKHGGSPWIVKVPTSGRGQGVKVINQWWEIPKWHSVVVQRYISRPKLINGSKFDLRIYVLLTSINPTRIYIYEEGLVRFASVRYIRGSTNLSDRYMHLTNTSVNKQNPQYVMNDGVNSFRGHKWSFKSLWLCLADEGVNVTEIWSKIKDIVIKTIIATESALNAAITASVPSNYTCYELYGFDVLLDENYNPWLLEVNILPSLQTDSPLDLAIKGALVKNVLNLAGYRIPNSMFKGKRLNEKYGAIAHDYRLYKTTLTPREKKKQNEINAMQNRKEYLNSILENLTADDLRQLIRYEDECTQAENFEKIFPTKYSHIYLKFFENERYYDRLFDAWEHRYCDDREEGIVTLKKLWKDMHPLNPSLD